MRDPSTTQILILAPVGFVAVWCLASKLVALGGWQQLAADYRAESGPPGQGFAVWQATVGLFTYQGILLAEVLPHGLRLRVLLPFRVGHPPLLIPWQAFGVMQVKAAWWTKYHTTIQKRNGRLVAFRISNEELFAAMHTRSRAVKASYPASRHQPPAVSLSL